MCVRVATATAAVDCFIYVRSCFFTINLDDLNLIFFHLTFSAVLLLSCRVYFQRNEEAEAKAGAEGKGGDADDDNAGGVVASAAAGAPSSAADAKVGTHVCEIRPQEVFDVLLALVVGRGAIS